jgi:hypothetical protein
VAIGRLGSFKTSTTVGLNTNTVLYTSTGTLSKVTINVANQGVEDATFSIGISSGTSFRDSDFIVYGQTIKKNTYVSITNVGISSGETIFTRANKENISFVALSVVDYDASIGTFFGRQESVRTSLSGPALVNAPVVLYTAPKAAQVSISVNRATLLWNRTSNNEGSCNWFFGFSWLVDLSPSGPITRCNCIGASYLRFISSLWS